MRRNPIGFWPVRLSLPGLSFRRARVAESVDAGGLNPPIPSGVCGFESHPGHHEGEPVCVLHEAVRLVSATRADPAVKA